jgi:uncharacterized protein (TIGR02246 family)
VRRIAGVLAFAALLLQAQEDSRQQDREELRKILTAVEAAINAQDIEAMLAQMDPNCTVVWWNAEVSHGHQEIRAYYRKMVQDEGRLITKYMTSAKLSGPARFVGDVAIADGSMEDEFFPVIRGSFKLDSRWSATVAKLDGKWSIIQLHLSSNVFTNTLMAEVTRMIWYVGAGALIVGILAGWFLGRRRQPRIPPAARKS